MGTVGRPDHLGMGFGVFAPVLIGLHNHRTQFPLTPEIFEPFSEALFLFFGRYIEKILNKDD